jgi:uncharacterized protein (DUF2267 family)
MVNFLSTNITSLDRAISNTVQWIDDIQEELGWDSRDNIYQATKAVLQSIRDRLPFEEVIHLSANLPLIMKGMMMDGYDLKNKPERIRDLEGFLEYVQANYNASIRDVINTEDATVAVIRVLNRRMGGGEMTKVALNMPQKLRRLFKEAGVEVPETAPMAATA